MPLAGPQATQREIERWRQRERRLIEALRSVDDERRRLDDELVKVEQQVAYYDSLTREMKRELGRRDFRAFFLRSGGRRRGLVHVTLDGTVRELRTVWLEDGMVKLIDQRYLPFDLRIYEAKNAEDVAVAIEDMVVRGAPAIGATAAYGMAQAGLQGLDLKAVGDRFRKTRPTGQDLFVAIDYMTKASANGTDLVAAADRYAQEDIDRCRNIGKHGAKLIRNGTRILTHCNAGALAL